mmetsp:Transcript_24311/g.58205  ORF Transcript_24311/g.58205 Transcript_24311/m.58205 type:complete len:306 (+) Transcript_24311:58-975(+)
MLSIVAVALATTAPSLQLRSRPRDEPFVLNLRGGADEAAPPAAPSAAPTALTPEEITEKLNGIPVFALLNKEGGIVSMRDPDGGEAPVCRWFVDATEAKMVLEAALAANPGVEGLHIGVHGLGNAFKLCGGWADEVLPELKATLSTGEEAAQGVSFRLQGNHALVKEVKEQLTESLTADGVEPGLWTLPIFFSTELQSRSIFPVFFHPKDLADAWLKAGRTKETVPEKMNMMDLRSFVGMLRKADNPWQLVQFVASRAAIKLASGDSSPDEGEEEVADAPAAKGVAAPAEDDEADLLGQQEEEEL